MAVKITTVLQDGELSIRGLGDVEVQIETEPGVVLTFNFNQERLSILGVASGKEVGESVETYNEIWESFRKEEGI